MRARIFVHINRRSVAFIAGAIVALACGPRNARADTVWNEAINGDLSGNAASPTSITVGLGVNSIFATSVAGDREYFTMTLAPGWKLEQIFLASYTGTDLTAFIAVQTGSVFTEPPTGTNTANLLGWSHFGPGVNTVGTDILDNMGVGSGAMGFTPPLPSGSYTFWSQQTGVNAVTYQFDFLVTPGPSTLSVLMLGVVTMRRRRR